MSVRRGIHTPGILVGAVWKSQKDQSPHRRWVSNEGLPSHCDRDFKWLMREELAAGEAENRTSKWLMGGSKTIVQSSEGSISPKKTTKQATTASTQPNPLWALRSWPAGLGYEIPSFKGGAAKHRFPHHPVWSRITRIAPSVPLKTWYTNHPAFSEQQFGHVH